MWVFLYFLLTENSCFILYCYIFYLKHMFTPNHLHLIVKWTFRNPPITTDALNTWFVDLVKKVRMVVVAGPTSVYVADEGNEGVTGTVTLATSHASMHVWEKMEPPMFQFDIYSCSSFTSSEVIEHLDYFGLLSYEFIFLDRNDGINIIESGKKENILKDTTES